MFPIDSIPPYRTFQDDIHKKFLNLVQDMVDHGIDLPPQFQLYYIVTEYNDKGGQSLNIKPYLSLDAAKSAKINIGFEEVKCEGNNTFGWQNNYVSLVTSDVCINTEFYATNFEDRTNYEIDYFPKMQDH